MGNFATLLQGIIDDVVEHRRAIPSRVEDLIQEAQELEEARADEPADAFDVLLRARDEIAAVFEKEPVTWNVRVTDTARARTSH